MITPESLNDEIGHLIGVLRILLVRTDVAEIHKIVRAELKRIEEGKDDGN